MAILSNVNGKFAVDSTGAIQFSGQTGTSGYVLKSNGNAAPTWVDGSTVIGGPYLPLSGGTLTGATATASGISFTVGGALTGTTAGFSGSITASGNSNSFGNTTIAALSASTGTFSASVTAAGNSNSFGTTTFSGNVTANGYLTSNGSFTTSSFWGTLITAGTGSYADFALLDSGTTRIMHVPTGTRNVVFESRVGIGTVSPQSLLQVGSIATANFVGPTDWNQVARFTSTNRKTSIVVQASGSGASASNQGLPAIEFDPYAVDNGGRMKTAIVAIDNYYGYRKTDLAFVLDSANDLNPWGIADTKMIIKNNGNVGIGTTSPAAGSQLTLRSSGSTGITMLSASNTGECFINFSDNDDANVGQIFYGHSPDRMAFRVGDDTRVTILGSNGNVGIGITSPDTKLNITSGGVIRVNSNSTGSKTFLEYYYNGSYNHGLAAEGDRGLRMYSSTGDNSAKLTFFTEGSEKMRITSGGVIGMGDTNPTLAERLVIAASSGSGNVVDISTGTTANTNVGAIVFRNSARNYCGQITVNGATAVTSYLSASDYRLKEDLQDFQGLSLVSNIKVYDYKWKSVDERTYGVMAHELQEILPQAVNGEKDAEEMQSVDYSKVVPLLVKSIQELEARIKILENK